jgi:hypothetical protein
VDPDVVKILQKQRDALQAEVGRLSRENTVQSERIQELERAMKILQTRLALK